jgi:hypothetical protein
MSTIVLEEIDIPNCYQGRVRQFNEWRLAIAEMTGVPIWYVISEKAVSLRSEGRSPAPTHLPFVEAAVYCTTLNMKFTPQRRLGYWETLPSDPLLIVQVLTVPGGVIRHQFAEAIADRLRELTDLMYGIDDGRWGAVDLGRFTELMQAGMRRIAELQMDSVVQGGFEPSGWWNVEGRF